MSDDKNKIVDINDYGNFMVSEVICVNCKTRWLSIRHTDTYLKEIPCPNCGPGFVIETGEMLEEDEIQAALCEALGMPMPEENIEDEVIIPCKLYTFRKREEVDS